jgi:hypothetical protein
MFNPLSDMLLAVSANNADKKGPKTSWIFGGFSPASFAEVSSHFWARI